MSACSVNLKSTQLTFHKFSEARRRTLPCSLLTLSPSPSCLSPRGSSVVSSDCQWRPLRALAYLPSAPSQTDSTLRMILVIIIFQLPTLNISGWKRHFYFYKTPTLREMLRAVELFQTPLPEICQRQRHTSKLPWTFLEATCHSNQPPQCSFKL